MLIDLFERPHSAEAPRSRAFIDQVFALSGPDGGIVHGEDGVSVQRPLREGGREAWDMLRRLRQKAWQKAGLDPDVLWTEKAQISVGAAQGPSSGEQMMRGLRENVIYTSNSSPFNEADADTPKAWTLDAFHGLVKAAQADADALKSADIAGDDVYIKQATPEVQESNVNNFTERIQAQRSHEIAPPSDKRGEQSRQVQRNSRSMHQPDSAARRPSPPAPSRSQSFRNLHASTRKDLKTPFAPQFAPAVDLPQHGVPPATTTKLEGSSNSSGVPTSPDGVNSSQEFDWDQWDAVFGQYVPVDDLMDLDAGETWRFGQE